MGPKLELFRPPLDGGRRPEPRLVSFYYDWRDFVYLSAVVISLDGGSVGVFDLN